VNIDVHEVIGRHLSPAPLPLDAHGYRRQSNFQALLGEARWAADRDRNSGLVIEPSRSQRWLGATAYLMLVDQIGDAFKPTASTEPANPDERQGPDFIWALEYFSSVSLDTDRNALYALRCAFAHEYALFNPSSRAKYRHMFNLRADPVSPLVEGPQVPWDGSFSVPMPSEQVTIVNLRKIGDVVEEMVATLRRMHAARQLTSRRPIVEFLVRYGMVFEPE
jgi:hypothetical protein